MRDQFTFYRSFWEALKALPKKDQLSFVLAIGSYVFEEESKPATGAAAASFLLVKPILDKASKRAASGKQGGSKPKANRKQTEENRKQTESEKEGEVEGEKEIEGEVEREVEVELENECCCYPLPPTPPTDDAAIVEADYLKRVNKEASPASLEELRGFVKALGKDVCLRAIDIALDSKKATWPYIRAILRDKQQRGVECLADWDALEAKRETGGKATKIQADEQRRNQERATAAQESAEWMDQYLQEWEERKI